MEGGEAPASTPVRVLIINPNTNEGMTNSLIPIVESLGYRSVVYSYFTCPEPGIFSINSPADSKESATICLPHILPLLTHHDVFLVACYSQHPLVPLLKEECTKLAAAATSCGTGARKYVTGILEASVAASLNLVFGNEGFGIVSTGQVWEQALDDAVNDMLGARESTSFAGCETTGLNGNELHDLPAPQVREKMMEATARLVHRGTEGGYDVTSICLGCAGMAGLDEAVRAACVEELGDVKGRQVHIVDGVKAGVGILISLARGGF